MMSDKWYLSGPMTGLPDHNFPVFHKAAKYLRDNCGMLVVSPAENFGGRRDLPREVYLKKDIELLLGCTGILLLDGWEDSDGARLELAIARELKLKVWRVTQNSGLEPYVMFDFGHVDSKPEGILDEAIRITGGARRRDYGHPYDNHLRIAQMWNAYIDASLTPEVPNFEFEPLDVAQMMILLKIARQIETPKRDNMVDIAGYANCGQQISEKEKELADSGNTDEGSSCKFCPCGEMGCQTDLSPEEVAVAMGGGVGRETTPQHNNGAGANPTDTGPAGGPQSQSGSEPDDGTGVRGAQVLRSHY